MNSTLAGEGPAAHDASQAIQRPGGGMPLAGLSLLGISVLFSLALLVYFGAWTASANASERDQAFVQGQPVTNGAAWWEDGVTWACPLH